MYKYQGLTLLELLVTISILALLVTLGVPSINSAQKTLQLKGAAETSYFAFQKARSFAIAKGVDISISFREGDDWCVALSTAGECDCLITKQCLVDDIDYSVNASDYGFISMQQLKFGTLQLTTFDAARGLSMGHAGSLVFSDGLNELKLILSNMGRVRICSVNNAWEGYAKC
ncbi:MAG: prepilin-type N-terminal cleavage/methylation domain-containing protein [Paraglaciecola sp.]|uniref:prepilin-type N-terminal cleavage/methylation domain-containing protein n=1 Tax=Paraglaciecola sp. TaxID=1920173 RepID=UPI0032650E49